MSDTRSSALGIDLGCWDASAPVPPVGALVLACISATAGPAWADGNVEGPARNRSISDLNAAISARQRASSFAGYDAIRGGVSELMIPEGGIGNCCSSVPFVLEEDGG